MMPALNKPNAIRKYPLVAKSWYIFDNEKGEEME